MTQHKTQKASDWYFLYPIGIFYGVFIWFRFWCASENCPFVLPFGCKEHSPRNSSTSSFCPAQPRPALASSDRQVTTTCKPARGSTGSLCQGPPDLDLLLPSPSVSSTQCMAGNGAVLSCPALTLAVLFFTSLFSAQPHFPNIMNHQYRATAT